MSDTAGLQFQLWPGGATVRIQPEHLHDRLHSFHLRVLGESDRGGVFFPMTGEEAEGRRLALGSTLSQLSAVIPGA